MVTQIEAVSTGREEENFEDVQQKIAAPDPQVNIRKNKKRTFSLKYKIKILDALDACDNASERGVLLRREGLYHSVVSGWRQYRAQGKLIFSKNRARKQEAKQNKLIRENAQLKKKLAQAEAVIDIQKKVSELFGQSILPHEHRERS